MTIRPLKIATTTISPLPEEVIEGGVLTNPRISPENLKLLTDKEEGVVNRLVGWLQQLPTKGELTIQFLRDIFKSLNQQPPSAQKNPDFINLIGHVLRNFQSQNPNIDPAEVVGNLYSVFANTLLLIDGEIKNAQASPRALDKKRLLSLKNERQFFNDLFEAVYEIAKPFSHSSTLNPR